jgi:hypothetical protein
MVLGIYYLFFNCNGWVEIASFCKTISPKTKKFDSAQQRKQYDRLSDALVISKTCLICYVMVKVVLGTYLVFNLNECIKLVAFCKTISPNSKKFDVASRKKLDRLLDAFVGSKPCLLFISDGSGNLLPLFQS